MVLETSQTADSEYGDNRSDRDGLRNRMPGTASSKDGRVTAEHAGIRAAGPHRCVQCVPFSGSFTNLCY